MAVSVYFYPIKKGKREEGHLPVDDMPIFKVIFLESVYFLNQNNSLLNLIASINWFNSWAARQKTKCSAKHGALCYQSLLSINYPTSHRKENN